MAEPVIVGPRPPLTRARSFAVVVGSYAVAVAVGVAAGSTVGSGEPLLAVLVADVAATLAVFITSKLLDNSSMYDPYWSVVPPAIAVWYLAVAADGVPAVRQVLVVAIVWAWGVRLTANWARGWPGLHHEDWRYVDMRTNGHPYWLQSLLGIHLFPTVQVFLGCLALYPALATGTGDVGPLDALAAAVGGGAVVLALLADEQLRAFNATKAPGEICTRGIWGWSRHPNYLGELSFWWALWLFALAADATWWWVVVGPLAMTAMFWFASIPMLDRRSLERRPGFAAHVAAVPALIPRRPRR